MGRMGDELGGVLYPVGVGDREELAVLDAGGDVTTISGPFRSDVILVCLSNRLCRTSSCMAISMAC